MHKCVPGTYDTLEAFIVPKNGITEVPQTHTRRKKSVRMASPIGSKLANISGKLDSRQIRVYPGQFKPKSVTKSVWPIAGLLACDLYLFFSM